jgi:hypothetical protein
MVERANGILLDTSVARRCSSLATATDFIKVPEQVCGILVDPCGAGALKFLLAVATGQ